MDMINIKKKTQITIGDLKNQPTFFKKFLIPNYS